MREGVMRERRSFCPLPLWERVAPHEVRRRVRGILPLGELCEDVLQNGGRLLQHVVVPVPLDSKPLAHQDGIPCRITLRRCVLTTVYFDDNAFLEADKVENELPKGHLPPEFKLREAPIT